LYIVWQRAASIGNWRRVFSVMWSLTVVTRSTWRKRCPRISSLFWENHSACNCKTILAPGLRARITGRYWEQCCRWITSQARKRRSCATWRPKAWNSHSELEAGEVNGKSLQKILSALARSRSDNGTQKNRKWTFCCWKSAGKLLCRFLVPYTTTSHQLASRHATP